MIHNPKFSAFNLEFKCMAACPPGFYSTPGDGNSGQYCRFCPAGRYFGHERGGVACMGCPSGKHQANFGQQRCSWCVGGQYADTSGAMKCTDCPASKFSPVVGGAKTCQACDKDSRGYEYQNEASQTRCKLCQEGWTTAVNDASRCLKLDAAQVYTSAPHTIPPTAAPRLSTQQLAIADHAKLDAAADKFMGGDKFVVLLEALAVLIPCAAFVVAHKINSNAAATAETAQQQAAMPGGYNGGGVYPGGGTEMGFTQQQQQYGGNYQNVNY